MNAQVVRNESKPWFLDAIGEVAAFSGRLLKNFILLVLVGLGFGVLVAIVMYASTSAGAVWRGSIAALIGFVGSCVMTFVTAGQLSIVVTLSETVKVKALGRRILDKLFSELLGVTTENPHGSENLTKELHGLPISEAEARLKNAARVMVEERVSGLPKIALWLVNKAQRLLVWATIRVVISYATKQKSRKDSIDMLALRESLALEVDDLLVDKIRQGAFRVVLFVVIAFLSGCWGIVIAMQKAFGI
jgi:hypothetical protein